jgi:hypothetical protein
MTEQQREHRRQRRAEATGKPVTRRLGLVPRGPKKSPHPLGLTDVQAKVVDSLMRHGHWKGVAHELGMKGSAVRQRIVSACRRAGVANSIVLVVAWSRAKWEREYVAPVWKGLAA